MSSGTGFFRAGHVRRIAAVRSICLLAMARGLQCFCLAIALRCQRRNHCRTRQSVILCSLGTLLISFPLLQAEHTPHGRVCCPRLAAADCGMQREAMTTFIRDAKGRQDLRSSSHLRMGLWRCRLRPR